jgi:hypothetical protein
MSWADLLSRDLTAEQKLSLPSLRWGKAVAGVGVARLVRHFVDSESDFTSIDIDQREDTVPDTNRIADRKFELLHAPPPAGAQMPVLQVVTVGTLCRDDCCKLPGALSRGPAAGQILRLLSPSTHAGEAANITRARVSVNGF